MEGSEAQPLTHPAGDRPSRRSCLLSRDAVPAIGICILIIGSIATVSEQTTVFAIAVGWCIFYDVCVCARCGLSARRTSSMRSADTHKHAHTKSNDFARLHLCWLLPVLCQVKVWFGGEDWQEHPLKNGTLATCIFTLGVVLCIPVG